VRVCGLQIPPSNASAICKELIVYVSQIRDTKTELAEIKAPGAGADSKAGAKDAEDDLEDDGFSDDFEEDDGQFSEAEYAAVAPIQDMCAVGLTLIKSLYLFILKVKSADSAPQVRVHCALCPFPSFSSLCVRY
jgi:hypothetical protein